MVHLPTLLLATSVVLTSFSDSPGAMGAAVPLPLQAGLQRPVLHGDLEKVVKPTSYETSSRQQWIYPHNYVKRDDEVDQSLHRRSNSNTVHKPTPSKKKSNSKSNKKVSKFKKVNKLPSTPSSSSSETDEQASLIDIDVNVLNKRSPHENNVHKHKPKKNKKVQQQVNKTTKVEEVNGKLVDVDVNVNVKRSQPLPRRRYRTSHVHKRSCRDGATVADQPPLHGKRSGPGKVVNKVGNVKSKGKKKGVSKVHRGGKRGVLPEAGVPGYVEVASPLFNSTLSRSIAGLIYSPSPSTSPSSTEPSFILGTSSIISTQFYLVSAPSSSNSKLNIVNIRVPILNSQTLKTTDWCATFETDPPSPLSLLPCGEEDGFSQSFSYDSTTGELQPLYNNEPAPMAMIDTSSSPSSPEASNSNSTSPQSLINTPAPTPVEQAQAQNIALYFVPAETYYQDPTKVRSLISGNGEEEMDEGMTNDEEEEQQMGMMEGGEDLSLPPSSASDEEETTAAAKSDGPSATATSEVLSTSTIMHSSTMGSEGGPTSTPTPAPTDGAMEGLKRRMGRW